MPLLFIRMIYDGCSVYKYWYECHDIHIELHAIYYVIFCNFARLEGSAALILTFQVAWIVTLSMIVFDPVRLQGMCLLHTQSSKAPRRIPLGLLDSQKYKW